MRVVGPHRRRPIVAELSKRLAAESVRPDPTLGGLDPTLGRPDPTLGVLKMRIDALGYPLPIADKMQKLEAVVPPAEWKPAVEGVYPIMADRLPGLLAAFLHIKARSGHPAEVQLYSGMTVEALVTRMLTKRPLSFLEEGDVYMCVARPVAGPAGRAGGWYRALRS